MNNMNNMNNNNNDAYLGIVNLFHQSMSSNDNSNLSNNSASSYMVNHEIYNLSAIDQLNSLQHDVPSDRITDNSSLDVNVLNQQTPTNPQQDQLLYRWKHHDHKDDIKIEGMEMMLTLSI